MAYGSFLSVRKMSLILLFYLMCFYKLSLCDKKDGLLLAEFMDTHNQFCRIRDPGCGYDARQLTPCCGFCDCGPTATNTDLVAYRNTQAFLTRSSQWLTAGKILFKHTFSHFNFINDIG